MFKHSQEPAVIQQQFETTLAQQAATRNLRANLAAISRQQPALPDALEQVRLDPEWVLGRDGCLTARLNDQWWSGCSLPRRAAQSVLRNMELRGQVACFVSPAHAAQIRFSLERMTPGQALVAVVPDPADLWLTIACDDFAAEIDSGRLWFATGDNWPQDLANLLRQHEGLPTPAQFVRTHLLEQEHTDALIAAADAVIQKENARRAQRVMSIFAAGARAARAEKIQRTILAVAATRFRLWDDTGDTLRRLAIEAGWRTLDMDDPCQSSAVAFAKAAATSRAVLIANASRSDLPPSLPPDLRVISWLTNPRIPRYDTRCANDALILADAAWRAPAAEAGWPDDRVVVGAWPTASASDHDGSALALIADTSVTNPPDFELSSHRLLWNTIAAELTRDPFVVAKDAAAYLAQWCRRAGIEEQTLDRRLFLERLIVPAYQQTLARLLIDSGIHLKLWGRGWDNVEGLSGHHAGEIHTREEFAAAVKSSAALVHAWPTPWAHPIDAAGKPVLRIRDSRSQWLQDAHALQRGANHTRRPDVATTHLNARIIESLLA